MKEKERERESRGSLCAITLVLVLSFFLHLILKGSGTLELFSGRRLKLARWQTQPPIREETFSFVAGNPLLLCAILTG